MFSGCLAGCLHQPGATSRRSRRQHLTRTAFSEVLELEIAATIHKQPAHLPNEAGAPFCGRMGSRKWAPATALRGSANEIVAHRQQQQ